ncbi:MAG TPA: prohibitin family protein [Anaerolineae bacterium]|nr:prohibitin family protein [Anaerolineae bacterium]
MKIKRRRDKEVFDMRKQQFPLPSCSVLVVVGVVLLALILASSSYVQVRYGSVGVVTRFGAVTGRVMQPGLNWKIPLIDGVVRYRTQEIIYQTASEGESQADYVDFPTDTTTADGQQIILKYSIRFRIDPEKVSWIANNIGNERDVVEKIVKFHSRILARNIPKEYAALDLYTGNIQAVQDQFEAQLKPLFAEKGIILDSFGLRKIEFTEDYRQAVEQKQIEAENVITEQHRAEQAVYRAKARVEMAKGEAQSTIERARGDAEKVKLLAAAEAEAIQIKGEALAKYPAIIQLQFVESLSDPQGRVTWGIMPPGSFVPFLNLTPGETMPGATIGSSTVPTTTTP